MACREPRPGGGLVPHTQEPGRASSAASPGPVAGAAREGPSWAQDCLLSLSHSLFWNNSASLGRVIYVPSASNPGSRRPRKCLFLSAAASLPGRPSAPRARARHGAPVGAALGDQSGVPWGGTDFVVIVPTNMLMTCLSRRANSSQPWTCLPLAGFLGLSPSWGSHLSRPLQGGPSGGHVSGSGANGAFSPWRLQISSPETGGHHPGGIQGDSGSEGAAWLSEDTFPWSGWSMEAHSWGPMAGKCFLHLP